MLLEWSSHPRLGSPSTPPWASVTQTTSNGVLYYSELSPPVQQKVEIKRGLLATYWINIRDWAIGDVMWRRWSHCWFSWFGNQKPKTPDPQRPHAHQTHASHRHDRQPPQCLTPGKTVPAHHTSIFKLTRKPHAWCQANPASDDPSCNLQRWETSSELSVNITLQSSCSHGSQDLRVEIK